MTDMPMATPSARCSTSPHPLGPTSCSPLQHCVASSLIPVSSTGTR